MASGTQSAAVGRDWHGDYNVNNVSGKYEFVDGLGSGTNIPLPKWVELMGAIVTLMAGIPAVIGAVNKWSPVVIVILFAVAVLAIVLMVAMRSGHFAVRVGSVVFGYVLKSESTKQLHWRRPKAVCTYCPSRSSMRLVGQETGLIYQCKKNPQQHYFGFDWTQLPDPATS